MSLTESLYHKAFDHSIHPCIISSPQNHNILVANVAALKLFGYSGKEILSLKLNELFAPAGADFKKMMKLKTEGNSCSGIVSIIKKNRKTVWCEMTSSVFLDGQRKTRSITTVADMSKGILKQKNLDVKNSQVVADNIVLAETRQKDLDVKNNKVVADNIVIAKTKQKGIDVRNRKLVAENIQIAKTKQKGIDLENEKMVAYNISLAKTLQLAIDARQEKIQQQQLSQARADARDSERSDIGKELHDNVNQLLGASKMYLEMGKRGGTNSEMYFSRSSEYTMSAIEAIRKLTKGLITDIIKNLGLSQAIENIAHDTMEVSQLKISCNLDSFQESSVNDKFKLNTFRIVQEQLTNILKHAQATAVVIDLLQDDQSVILSVADNGIGFNTSKKRSGIGVTNIKSRAAAYKGVANLVSRTGDGCVLDIRFPLAGNQRN